MRQAVIMAVKLNDRRCGHGVAFTIVTIARAEQFDKRFGMLPAHLLHDCNFVVALTLTN